VRWMEDSDEHDNAKSSWQLIQQFTLVANETLQSQPQQYGNLKMNTEPIEDFQANGNGMQSNATKHHKKGRHLASSSSSSSSSSLGVAYTPCGDPTDSRDVKLKTLVHMRNKAVDEEELTQLNVAVQEELANRAWWDVVVDHVMVQLLGAVEKDRLKKVHHKPRNFGCLKDTISRVEASCGRFDDYSLKWVYTLVNMCEEGVPPTEIGVAFEDACSQY